MTSSRLLFVLSLFTAPVLAAPPPQLIVDWGHDWGTGWYQQKPSQQVNGAWRPLDSRDLNGNGTTEDDWIAGWGYDWDTPLSPDNLVYDNSFPSATFYGAAVVRVTDLPKKENGSGYEKGSAPSEGHINQNHELRDDWNLMSMPMRKRHPELSTFAAAMLVFWKKEDFLNGGDQYDVSLPAGSSIGVFISRYWGGMNWGPLGRARQRTVLYLRSHLRRGNTSLWPRPERPPGRGRTTAQWREKSPHPHHTYR